MLWSVWSRQTNNAKTNNRLFCVPHRCDVGVFVRIVFRLGHVGAHERHSALHRVVPGLPDTGVAVMADLVAKRRGAVQGEPETGSGQQVRRGHRNERPDRVFKKQRVVDNVQRETVAGSPAVHVQAVPNVISLFSAQPVFRAERAHVLRS